MVDSVVVVDGIYSTLVPDDYGGAACLHWARGVPGYGPPLTLLDFDVGQLTPDFWDQAEAKQQQLAKDRHSRHGVLGIWVEGELLAQYADARGHYVRAILEHIAAPTAWRGLCAIVMSYRRDEQVAITAQALEKAKTVPFGAMTFRGGERPAEDATVAAYLYGVTLGLDIAAARPPRPAKVKVVA